MNPSSAISLVLRLTLGGFFVWSGWQKLSNLTDFVDTVANYQIVDRPWDAIFGYFVPWLEIIVGLAIVSGIWLKSGLLILMIMLLGFNGAIAWVWSEGLNINCGCYGKSDEPTNYPLHLAYNFGLIALSVGLFWTSLRQSARRLA